MNSIFDKLLQAFLDKKRSVMPRYTATPADIEAVRKASVICETGGHDPEIFLIAQLYFHDGDITTFYSPFLHSKNAERNVQEFLNKSHIPPADSYEVQCDYMRGQVIGLGRDFKTVLMDDTVPLTAWFRVMVTKEPDKDVLARYFQKARMELTPELASFLKESRNPRFDYRRLIPE